MADFSGFRSSPNIEDRRQDEPIDLMKWPRDSLMFPNVFQEGHGTMTELNASTDFVPQPNSPSRLSVDAGINNLPALNASPIFAKPAGLYSDQVIGAESSGNPNSQSETSSASGPAGFTNGTWLETIKASRPDLAQGQSDDALLALKKDPVLAGQMADAYGAANEAYLAKNGLPVTPGTKYLAHFAGPGGAAKILQAAPNTPAGDVLGPAALKANPFLEGMTAQGLQAWAAKKMGVTAPQPGMQQASPAGPPSAIPPQAPPIFAQPQAAQAPQQAQAGPSAPLEMPPMQAPPIFASPRKPIDLSGLRAALARAPIFSQG